MDDATMLDDGSAGCSRRSFLKGAGAAAGFAFLAGAGLTATGCAPSGEDGPLAATGQEVVTPNGTYEVYETDLLVCGCGYAGIDRKSVV